MKIATSVRPLTDDDATIRAALADADIPSLMVTIAHLTGDMDLLRGDIRPAVDFLGDPNAAISEAQQARVRETAFEVLKRYRDAPFAPAKLSEPQIREMINFLTGQEMSEDYVQFLEAELSLNGEDPYAQPQIFEVPEQQRSSFKVAIIGAGMSGLLAGIRLKEAGIPFVILEKNPDVGGTWFENTYPGCRVDSANHVYSYSFRPKDWPQHFSNQEVLRKYFSECADDYGLRESTRFNTEVVAARFDQKSSLWNLELKGPSGADTIQANAVISAMGQLNRPKLPDIPGRDRFQGVSFHSARWRHDVDLTGKRVGVIGTGASAFQFVPIISRQASSVTIFQRTAPWVVPNPDYFQEVPSGKHWLLNHVPFYARWFRFTMFWRAAEGLLGSVAADDKWQVSERSVSEANEQFRQLLVDNLQAHFADRPDLLAKCTPDYPPGAKRALIDDGTWFESLKRDNVALLTDPIAEITESGVKTRSGVAHEFDVIVFATGFMASEFMHPVKIYGLDGKELHEVWQGEPRAYKGISIPGFPNLFCCYGPNTNIVVNGSIVFFSECEIRYILGCLALLMRENKSALDVKRAVHDAYNQRIDAGNRTMAWGRSGVSTWYKNASGRITQNWPFTLLEFWQQTREPERDDYSFI
ncbi:MAG: NAD(P)/FAD-dependent oxidoreductase [Pseudomonadales bacterium]